MAKLRRSVILNVGKDLSYITDGSVKWCGPFGKLGFPGGSDGRESTLFKIYNKIKNTKQNSRKSDYYSSGVSVLWKD